MSGKDEKTEKRRDALRNVLSGKFIEELITKQFNVLLIVFLFSLFNIADRYYCEKQLTKIDKLQKELRQLKYSYLTISNNLVSLRRESNVKEMIDKKKLYIKASVRPPYKIKD